MRDWDEVSGSSQGVDGLYDTIVRVCPDLGGLPSYDAGFRRQALCSTVIAVAEEKCPAMLPKARAVYIKFVRTFSAFAKCHHIYNGRGATDDDIKKLGMCTQ